jgi:hypothetical protein
MHRLERVEPFSPVATGLMGTAILRRLSWWRGIRPGSPWPVSR